MKKIEVKKYEDGQLILVYELDESIDDANEYDEIDFNDINIWNKIDVFDPMVKENSGCNIGYRGEGPRTLSKIIVETFRVYGNSKSYIKARENVEDYISKLPNDDNQGIDNFVLIEKDIEELLDV
jgi:hypothetical protein